jgi:hypothetical protein
MIPRKKILLFLVLNLLVLFLVLACAEIYFSMNNLHPVPRWGWADTKERPKQKNELGFRGRSIQYGEEDYVVLLVGDSQVQADVCPFHKMPERRLEQYLSQGMDRPVKVFTVGAQGYGQDQEFLNMKRYFSEYRADRVVVWETAINDTWNNIFPTHLPKDGWPKPTFWLDEAGELQGPNREWSEPMYSRFRVLSLFFQSFQGSLDEAWEKEHLPPIYEYRDDHGGAELKPWWLELKWEHMESEKSHLNISFVPTSERTLYGVRLTNKLLLEMAALANRHGAGFTAFAENRPDFPCPDGIYALEIHGKQKYVEMSRQQFWDNMQKANEGIDYFVVPVTVKVFRGERDPHLSELATEQVIKDASKELLKRILGQ